jgi:hypothetical protein
MKSRFVMAITALLVGLMLSACSQKTIESSDGTWDNATWNQSSWK